MSLFLITFSTDKLNSEKILDILYPLGTTCKINNCTLFLESDGEVDEIVAKLSREFKGKDTLLVIDMDTLATDGINIPSCVEDMLEELSENYEDYEEYDEEEDEWDEERWEEDDDEDEREDILN